MSIAKTINKKTAMWIATLGLPLAVMLIPTNASFTSQIRLFAAVTVMAVLMFAFENVHMTISATLLPVAYIVLGLATPEVAFKAWTSNLPWLVMGGILVANALTECGLIQRVVFKCMSLIGGSYNGIIWGIGVCGLILAIFVPSKAIYPLAAFAYGLCRSLNIGKSKASAGIMLAAIFSALIPGTIFYNPYIIALSNFGMEATGPVRGLGWFDFIIYQWVTVLFLVIMLAFLCKFFKPEQPLQGKEYFKESYKKLGKLTFAEKKGIIISFALLVLLMTSSLTGLDAGWIFIICGMAFFCPGINVANADNLKNVNFGFIIFVASCATIGNVAVSLDVGTLIANACLPLLEGRSVTFVLICIWIICVLMNFALTPMAVMATFAVPFAQIVLDLGINPTAMYFVMSHALDQLLFPYEYAQYLFAFSFGMISMKHFMQAMGVKMIANFIFVFTILLGYWKLTGFLML